MSVYVNEPGVHVSSNGLDPAHKTRYWQSQASSGVGLIDEVATSRLTPWIALAGLAYLIMKSPDARTHLRGTAKGEIGRARAYVTARYRAHRARRK